ncbi:MAG: hypothetical protein KGL39_18920 [Patescibacteria group bacterium]|nr:hypothetical protein [Patescibacteria group bacterium]
MNEWGGIVLDKLCRFDFDPDWDRTVTRMVFTCNPDLILLERVHSIAGQGHVGAFTFGDRFGSARTAVRAAHKEPRLVEPQWWQRRLGMPRHSDEPNDRKRRALRLKDQKARSLQYHPELACICKPKKSCKCGDPYAATLIARAGMMDLLEVPPGMLYET